MSAARDFFSWRRERAGIPDAVRRTPCGLALIGRRDELDALELAGVPVVCGLPECEPCGRAAAGFWFGSTERVQ